ncbi:divalent cation tolerance protein CutA [Cesiribacter sp. SM1]|uniref:divalent cation tolerance protein CutA n=1 Tax=Cesiribacter sp. SM1 TaxID=2861196 RepID=UPI001CD217D6|nr:divalent cation tolerance protein CutA [Cesiribacter sp. SM1]
MVLIYVSLSEDSQASKLAEQLLMQRLANHINIIRNNECMMYSAGKVQKSYQTILLIKTKATLYKLIEERIQALNISPTPRIFSVPMTQLDADYHSYLTNDIL